MIAHAAMSGILGHRRDLDPYFHFLGGAAGAFALLRAMPLFPGLANPALPRREGLCLVGLMLGVALLWEAAEFVSDLVAGTHIQRGLSDTGGDVALGVAGAVVVATIRAISARRE